MLGTRMETEVVEVLLMKMLVHDKTTLGSQGRRYCALLHLPAVAVDGRAHLGGLRVLRTLFTIMDP